MFLFRLVVATVVFGVVADAVGVLDVGVVVTVVGGCFLAGDIVASVGVVVAVVYGGVV